MLGQRMGIAGIIDPRVVDELVRGWLFDGECTMGYLPSTHWFRVERETMLTVKPN